ncbi:cytochrome P450 family protein [Nocardiopsis salina]|uniref:cytochrome P450 family protein n=1 Tax=Nocardiopsis salina TaxID=245836 RepID=UPI00036F6708|nr:cytochrome P450 [Nocardiopsis salina]
MTTHAGVTEAIGDPRIQKNRKHWRAFNAGEIPADWPMMSWIVNENMLSQDGDTHTRLRKLISKAFTPRRVEHMRGDIVAIVDRLLDELQSEAGRSKDGVVDFKELVAMPLPLTVISELFGLRTELRGEMHDLVSMFFDQSTGPEQAMNSFSRLWEVLTELVAEKRENPGDDLTSDLIAARDDQDRLTESELIWTLVLFISAGYETTMNLIPNVVRALIQHPDQLKMLLDGEVEWAKATEEVLRWDPPAEYVPMRYTTEDMELAGVSIPKGEALLMGYGSSGHDEDRHGPTATVFDIEREDTSHLSFSHGRHYCIGANLARMEVNELVPRVFERFPKIRIAVDDADLEPMPSIIVSGVKELPVRVD